MKNYQELLDTPLIDLIKEANDLRAKYQKDQLDICTILNAKSGACSENCKFCAQSSWHKTEIPIYPMQSKDEIIQAAQEAKNNGALRFGIVTSGNRLNSKELEIIAEAIKEITGKIKIIACASLGALTKDELALLKAAGLKRYHHNIETSENFYPKIVSTHTFKERLETIKAVKELGLEICSGGIIGLGESWQDRLDMALKLKELDVDAIPINFLIPIPGTALENQAPIDMQSAIKTIAIFRIILPNKTIKIAAGRDTILKDFQGLGFMAGANGMLIGGYLTTRGRSVKEDQNLITEIKRLWQN